MTKDNIVEFQLFLILWNRRQNMTTPAIHFRMAGWLQNAWETKETRLLLQAFRSSGKSTIAGLFAAWLLHSDPDLRILVLAADLALARKMVRNVKRIIERHPLTTHLKPDRADQWGADRFTVKRHLELRDPSMLASGMSANMTGSRADVVISDDVEVPKTCDTAEKRENLRERLAEIDYVMVPGGTQLYIGTPHSWYTIYAPEPRTETGEDRPFLEAFERLVIPVWDEEGQSAWPERFSVEDIERIRRSTGPQKFASQMLLRPANITEGRLDPAQLQFYDGGLQYYREINRLELEGRQMVSCSAWWDPAFGHAGGDRSVLAVVFTDDEGDYWLHRLVYLSIDKFDPDDEATQQCRAVAWQASLLKIPCITLEINGLGRFLPAILRRELAKKKVACAVQEATSTRPKNIRILEAFDAVLAARALHINAEIKKTPFITEMQEWQPTSKNSHDDGLDAVAGALSLAPVRLKYDRSGTIQHTIKTDFEV